MRRAGFTLIELLVAMVVALMLVGLLLSVTNNLLGTWQRTQGNATTAIAAKLALDQLERDLQSAIVRDDGNQWIDARILGTNDLAAHGWKLDDAQLLKPDTVSMDVLAARAPGIASAKFGRSGIWLRFVASEYDSKTGASAPRAIAYQIARLGISNSTGSPVRYSLFRTIMSAQKTFDGVLENVFSASAPAELIQPSRDEVIANNVVDFGVWISKREPDGVETSLYPTTGNTREISGNVDRGVIWIMIRILTEEGAAQLEAMENGNVLKPTDLTMADWWWKEVESHSHVFTRRIELKGEAI